ncbi:MAG: hypothetical protein M0Z80_11815 [Treponema sp.]|nr:hypothetical protein [Treponema sp.]
MIQWNAEFARRLSCREEEKRQMAPLIRRFMDLARIAGREGYQSLEASLSERDDPLLALGLRLVIEGLPEPALEDVLATYLVAEDRSGWPFLKACVIIEGLLALAAADEPALLARKLVAYYGADRAAAVLEELERETEEEPRAEGAT